MGTPQKISIIVSVYNEEEVLPAFFRELWQVISGLSQETEILFVNDGSLDGSSRVLNELAENHSKVKIIHFSRNFGHEAAMIAGLDHCTGDVAICMDADLQHPPDKIPEMLEKFGDGYDIVNMVRNNREDGGILKKLTSSLFYKFLNSISDYTIERNASDFFLVSRRVVELFHSNFRERTRFLRGFIQMVGFSKTTLSYVAPSRAGGKSKYSLMRLLMFSAVAISSTSRAPLRVSLILGVIFGGFSLVVAIYSIIQKILGTPFSGYTTLVVLMSLGFSLLFLLLGIIGQYLGDIFIEIKGRPIYIVEKIVDKNK